MAELFDVEALKVKGSRGTLSISRFPASSHRETSEGRFALVLVPPT